MSTTRSAAPPIFLLGAMRSGTTLLRLMLDSHPDVAIGTETGFMRGFDAVKDTPSFRYGRHWYKRLGIGEEEIDRRLGAFFESLFEEGARRHGALRWGDKTPFHVWHGETMARVFPNAQFVALVRHPVAVVRSLEQWRYTEIDAIKYWAAVTAELVHLGHALEDRLCLIRYEDLVTDAQAVMSELLAFLDLPWSDDVLRHHVVHASVGALVEGGTDATKPIDPSRAFGRLTAAPETMSRELDRKAGALCRGFGYLVEPPFITAIMEGERRSGPVVAGSRIGALFDQGVPSRRPQPEVTLPPGVEVRDLLNEVADLRSRRSIRVGRAAHRVLRSRRPKELRAALGSLAHSFRKVPARRHLISPDSGADDAVS